MKNTFLLTILTSFFSSCGMSGSGVQEQSSPKTKFEKFVESVPLIELPFELSSDQAFDHILIDSPFIPEGANLIGRLQSQNNRALILYSYPADIQLPILEVYENNGQKINQATLFHYGTCPLTSNGSSKCIIQNEQEIYLETICDVYDSRIDLDTIRIEELLK